MIQDMLLYDKNNEQFNVLIRYIALHRKPYPILNVGNITFQLYTKVIFNFFITSLNVSVRYVKRRSFNVPLPPPGR